ncbi:hypothetical protein EV643_108311 [Kribbella sp. VKM Ac-2527]|uniref:ANTAR domain-containing protein n=1 Tax=Kribbella caucasensis TaxID=2512215 RepID=A0A4R6KHN3_9ACTN|nr:hypothetical protein EV643_108311 [Kribbella sp. VKM Ac-2527]
MIPSHSVEPATRPCLKQATALLTEWFGVTASQADALIATCARNCRRSPKAVAEVLVHQVWRGDGIYLDPAVARTLEHALRKLPEVVAASMDSEVAIGPRGDRTVSSAVCGFRLPGRRPASDPGVEVRC